MATLSNGKVSGVTTESSIKDFFPDIVKYFKPDMVDKAIGWYIKRVELLLNSAGFTFVDSDSFSSDMELIGNMSVRRLVWSDAHPATSGDAAGVRAEAARGVSYSMYNTPRTIQDILGPEIITALSTVGVTNDRAKAMSTNVFDPPFVQATTFWDETFQIFDLGYDDRLEPNLVRSVGDGTGIVLRRIFQVPTQEQFPFSS